MLQLDKTQIEHKKFDNGTLYKTVITVLLFYLFIFTDSIAQATDNKIISSCCPIFLPAFCCFQTTLKKKKIQVVFFFF